MINALCFMAQGIFVFWRGTWCEWRGTWCGVSGVGVAWLGVAVARMKLYGISHAMYVFFAASGAACLIGLSYGRSVARMVFHTTGRSRMAHALWHDGRHETSHRLGL